MEGGLALCGQQQLVTWLPIERFRDHYKMPVVAKMQAMALFNATTDDGVDTHKCEVIADRIGAIRAKYDTPEIAHEQAKALCNGIAGTPNRLRCEQIAELIEHVLEAHNTAEIALTLARVLHAASVNELDPQYCELLANKIGDLLKGHATTEIADQQAETLLNAIARRESEESAEPLVRQLGVLCDRFPGIPAAELLRKWLEGSPDA